MGRLPSWFRVKFQDNGNSRQIGSLLGSYRLNSVCQSAHCPNKSECWAAGTATFMIMGQYCTRGCRFCAVKTLARPPPLDPAEPENLAEAVSKLGLRYIVITSVDRDDLEDDGAGHYAECVRRIKEKCPDLILETLIPDFKGKESALDKLIASGPHVISHNVESVERLNPEVRDRRANYRQSLRVLEYLYNNNIRTKSGFMVGFGETREEVKKTMEDLLSVGVELITIGQYLQPSKLHYPLKEYISPEQFREYERMGLDMGFRYVAAGPLVRSSYRAAEAFFR